MGLTQVRLDSGDVASVVADFLSQFDLLSPPDRANAMQTMISDLPEMLYSIRNDAIIDMVKAGSTNEEVADLLLVSEQAVSQVLVKAGYERQRKTPVAAHIPLHHPASPRTH